MPPGRMVKSVCGFQGVNILPDLARSSKSGYVPFADICAYRQRMLAENTCGALQSLNAAGTGRTVEQQVAHERNLVAGQVEQGVTLGVASPKGEQVR